MYHECTGSPSNTLRSASEPPIVVRGHGLNMYCIFVIDSIFVQTYTRACSTRTTSRIWPVPSFRRGFGLCAYLVYGFYDERCETPRCMVQPQAEIDVKSCELAWISNGNE